MSMERSDEFGNFLTDATGVKLWHYGAATSPSRTTASLTSKA